MGVQPQPQLPQQLQLQCVYNDAHNVRRNVDFMDGVNEYDDSVEQARYFASASL